MRNVEAELGIGMIEMLLKERFGPAAMESNLGLIIKFLNARRESGEMKSIKRDEWNCLIDFIEETNGGDVSHFEIDEAMCWPILIDQLVPYLKEPQ